MSVVHPVASLAVCLSFLAGTTAGFPQAVESPAESPSPTQADDGSLPDPTVSDQLLRDQLDLARPFVGILEVEGPHQGSIMRQTSAFLIEPNVAVTSALTLSGGHGLRMRIGDQTRGASVCGLDLMQDVALLLLDAPFDVEAGLPVHAGYLVGNERVAILGNTVLMEEVAQLTNLTGAVFPEPLGSVGQIQNLSQQGLAGTPLLNDRGGVVGMLSSRVFRESGTRFVISGATIAQLPRTAPIPLSQSLVPALPKNGESEEYGDWLRMQQGINLLLAGHKDRALESLEGLTAERARMWLALALGQSQRHVEALEIIEELRKDRANSVELLLMQGVAQQKLVRPREAAVSFQMARSKAPDNATASLRLAQAYFAGGRGLESLKILTKVLHSHPGFLPAMLLRGEVMNDRLRFSEARIAYEEVLKIDPRNPRAWVGLGTMHLTQKSTKKAKDAFETALSLNPRRPGIPHRPMPRFPSPQGMARGPGRHSAPDGTKPAQRAAPVHGGLGHRAHARSGRGPEPVRKGNLPGTGKHRSLHGFGQYLQRDAHVRPRDPSLRPHLNAGFWVWLRALQRGGLPPYAGRPWQGPGPAETPAAHRPHRRRPLV